jgi:hypothetical protein
MKISGLGLIVEAPPPSCGAVHQPRYGPAEIATLLEGLQLARSLARTVEAFRRTPRRSRRLAALIDGGL